MLLVIGLFLLTQILYHFFVTFFGYGLGIIDQSTLALIRDGLWMLIIGGYCLYNIKYWKEYLKNYWKILVAFAVLLIFGFLTSYLLFHKSFNDILIGVKYGVWWMIILLCSTAIGFFMKKRNVDLHKAIPYVKRGLISILVFGWIWQGLKLIVPNVFYSMGYGKLDDFHYGENPPIYYLTGYEGDLRWQGIFSGPNNYGYFLVLFFPVIFYLFPIRKFSEIKKWEKKDWLNCGVNLAWILTIVATLSRAAIIGLVIILIVLNIKKLWKHKKISLSILALIILGLIGLSCLKRESTVSHIQAKWAGIQEVINQPLGYGLGSSGPAVHHSGMFLPENYYLQLMLDLGTVGFLLWCGVLLFGMFEQKNLRLKLIKKDAVGDDIYQLFIALQRGLLALLFMGLFLHVFEDSMVNYLFFVVYGVLLGYLSYIAEDEKTSNISIDKGLAWISIKFIRFYQITISPDKGVLSPFLKGRVCSHNPHCSAYGIQVLERYGFVQGLPMITDRVLACKPSSEKMYDPDHYRVVFFSSAPIGVPFLKELMNDKRFEVVGVVSQEDKPVGRGLKLTPNIIKTTALENGIPGEAVYTPTKIHPDKSLEGKNFYDWLSEKGADYFVVIAYGKIIPQVVLDIPVFGCINVHGSLLPKYRGASPLQSVFLNNEEMSGITIMHMDAGMDTGAMIDKLAFKIPFEWTVKDLIEKFEEKGPEFLTDTLWDYAKGSIKSNPQNDGNATYCQKITKQDGEIDPYKDSIESIYSKYRGYYLWPKIWFTLNDKKVVIEELELDEVKYNELKNTPLFDKANSLNACVKNIGLKPEGKKAMDYKSFKNGYLK